MFCLSDQPIPERTVDLLLIFLTIEMRKVAGELFEIVLIIRAHIGMKRPVIFVIRRGTPALKRQQERALPAQIFFLRFRAAPDTAARINRVCKI